VGKPFGLPGTSNGTSFLLVCWYTACHLSQVICISTRDTIKLREPPKARKMTTKKCCSCEEIKDTNEFTKRKASWDGFLARCKLCDKAYKIAYHTAKPDKKKAWDKKYKSAIPEKVKARNAQYYRGNWDTLKEKRVINEERIKAYRIAYKSRYNERISQRRRNDINFKMTRNLRTRFHSFVSTKGKKTFNVLGMPCDTFLSWIEFQFVDGMTWDNYGDIWHLDHILPVSKFDLTNEIDQRVCFNWTNFQPLYAQDNLSKSNSIYLHDFFNCFISAHRFVVIEDLNSLEYQTLAERLRWLRATISGMVKSSWMNNGQSAAKPLRTQCQVYEEGSTTK